MNIKVISVGGSIIAPENPDVAFLTDFVKITTDWLSQNEDNRLILVAGGGAPARNYQATFWQVSSNKIDVAKFRNPADESLAADWIGVMATRLNAELLKSCFGDLAPESVVIDPTKAPENWQGKVLVAAGWKPGFSSDNDAVLLAEKYGAKIVINISNIAQVYTDDPRKNPDAKPLAQISWPDFIKMVGSEWRPGMNAPFDPIASKRAADLGLTVICAAGKDNQNTAKILNDEPFIGTFIAN